MTPAEFIAEAAKLSDRDLGEVAREIGRLYETRLRFFTGLTEDEQRLSKLEAIKRIRERTGLGLLDAKKLYEMWQAAPQ